MTVFNSDKDLKLDKLIERIAIALEKIADELENLSVTNVDENEIGVREDVYTKKDKPKWLNELNIETLAKEFVDFARKESVDQESIYLGGSLDRIFWASKGIANTWELDNETNLLLQKIQFKANQLLQIEENEKKRNRIEEEQKKIDELVVKYLEYAEQRGLKKVTRADIEALLFDMKIIFLPESIRNLWQKVNLKLKSN